MAEHILTRTLTLNLPREEVFAFFADAGNLERITPPKTWLHSLIPHEPFAPKRKISAPGQDDFTIVSPDDARDAAGRMHINGAVGL